MRENENAALSKEERRNARIDALDNNEKKKRRIIAIVIAVLVLFFLGGMVVGIQNVLLTEAAEPPVVFVDSASENPENNTRVIKRFSELIDEASDENRTKLDIKIYVDLNRDSIKVLSSDGTENTDSVLVNSLKYARNTVVDAITEQYYKSRELNTGYGTDFSDRLLPVDFSAADAKDVYFSEGEYGISVSDDPVAADYAEDRISVVINDKTFSYSTLDVFFEAEPDEGFAYTDSPYERILSLLRKKQAEYRLDGKNLGDYLIKIDINRDKECFTFAFPAGSYSDAFSGVLGRSFDMTGADEVIESLKNQMADVFTVKNSEIICSDFNIYATSERTTDRLQKIYYNRAYSVKMNVDFNGEFQKLGNQTLCFDFKVTEDYSFTWAGVVLSDSLIRIDKRDTQALRLTKNLDSENWDGVVTWTSSDESIATVDDEGYVKGHIRSETPVIITATVNYLGNTYTDECTVYVRKEVDEIRVSERKLELTEGESFTLTVEIKPENATLRGYVWKSTDENVARVDENGIITAVSPGTAGVYAVSEDGYAKSTCTVTVK